MYKYYTFNGIGLIWPGSTHGRISRSLCCGFVRWIYWACIAAVDDELASGHEAGLVRCVVEHTVGNVCGLADMTDRMEPVELAPTGLDIGGPLEVSADYGRPDTAGMDRVDADV
jgi:hypothetical protein